MGQHNEEEYIKNLKENMFPFQFDAETTYYLDDVWYVHTKRKYGVNIHDNNGYKIKTYSQLLPIKKRANIPFNLFFNGNPFTHNNISVFLKKNNIPLELNDFNMEWNAHTKLPFVHTDTKEEIKSITWNDIQSNPLTYNRDNFDRYTALRIARLNTKESVIQLIKKKEIELKRPLIQSDFEGECTSENSVGIRVIYKYWHNFSNMIDELGLMKHDIYFKPNAKNYISHNQHIECIKQVCDKVLLEGRNIVTTKDFVTYGNGAKVNGIRRHCKRENIDLAQMIERYGCRYQKSGCGMVYIFEDGEKTTSQYEYDFSQFLRNNGLVYNKDYYRDILYSNIDKEYKGSMNCDYKINYNGKLLYIELAGILGNTAHQQAFINNTVIESKSKETYRLKLNMKKELFEKNNIHYYILLKNDMNENTYGQILNELRKEVI